MKRTFRNCLSLLSALLLVACSSTQIGSSGSSNVINGSSSHASMNPSSNKQSSSTVVPSSMPVHEHTFASKWSYDEVYHYHASTCGHDVTKDKAEHDFGEETYEYVGPYYDSYASKRICKVCGYVLKGENKPQDAVFTFIPINDGEEYSISINDLYFHPKQVTIPSSYNNKPITRIESYGFYFSGIESITLPTTIKTIGEHAFSSSNIKSIVLPDGMISIEKQAFAECRSLTSISMPNSLESIGMQAFINCYELKNVTIGDNVSFVGEQAFLYCDKIVTNKKNGCGYLGNKENPYLILLNTYDKSMTASEIEDTCRIVCVDAFHNCHYLYKIVIPDNTVQLCGGCLIPSLISLTIGKNVKTLPSTQIFDACKVFELINKSSIPLTFGKQEFRMLVGQAKMIISDPSESLITIEQESFVVYEENNEKTLLGYIGNSKNVLIPNNITNIGDYAFTGNKEITSIVIPEGVTNIGYRAFSECDSLKEITIPNSIRHIGEDITFFCPAIERINTPDNMDDVEYTYLENRETFKETTYGGSTYLGNDENPYIILKTGSIQTINDHSIHERCRVIDEDAFYAIRGRITTNEIVIPDGVVKISNFAFYMASWATEPQSLSLRLPKSVRYLDSSAFSFYNLKSIYIPDSNVDLNNMPFNNCFNAHIEISQDNPNYTAIDDVIYSKDQKELVFCMTSKNGTYIMPDSVTSLAAGSFTYSRLNSIVFSKNLQKIGSVAFQNMNQLENVTLPNSLNYIGDGAFFQCQKLKSVTLPQSNCYIGASLFHLCHALTDVTLPDGIEYLPNSLFHHCTSLEHLVIPDSVKELSSVVLFACTSLKSVHIGKNVEIIGEHNFNDCENLESITVDPDNKYFAIKDGILYDKTFETLIKCPPIYERDIFTVPETVKTIAEGAFERNSSLKQIKLPSSISVIPERCFALCNNLTSIEIPDSVVMIKRLSFINCQNLSFVKISNRIIAIESESFRECASIKSLIVPFSIKYFRVSALPANKETILFYEGYNSNVLDYSFQENFTVLYMVTNLKYVSDRENYWHYVDGIPTRW